jgi:hypothetical protein
LRIPFRPKQSNCPRTAYTWISGFLILHYLSKNKLE